ncbi:hypothetical protein WCE41_01950 [Luteimonas sp. MJ246]|uniref:hypothetical protein n=1 Tax=Luteimonas sp. MJ174 TaxID=3129237 RepID=UPI0031BA5D3A
MIEFRSTFSITEDPTPAIQTAIKDVWEIYQAFAAYTIGEAFDLELPRDSSGLRTRWQGGASMKGHGLLLYYDRAAPGGLLPSWRSATTRPASERPDITLVDQAGQRVMVLDVKYSVDKQGRCRSEHLFEMQGYMNSFRIDKAAIVFPGDPVDARGYCGNGYTLAEAPLRARDILNARDEQLRRLRSQLEELWSTIPN